MGLGFHHVHQGGPVLGIGGFPQFSQVFQQSPVLDHHADGRSNIEEFVKRPSNRCHDLLDGPVQFDVRHPCLRRHHFARLGEFPWKGDALIQTGHPVLRAQAGLDGFGKIGEFQFGIGVAR